MLDADLKAAAMAALELDGTDARDHALGYGWRACAEMFVGNIRVANRLQAGFAGPPKKPNPTKRNGPGGDRAE